MRHEPALGVASLPAQRAVTGSHVRLHFSSATTRQDWQVADRLAMLAAHVLKKLQPHQSLLVPCPTAHTVLHQRIHYARASNIAGELRCNTAHHQQPRHAAVLPARHPQPAALPHERQLTPANPAPCTTAQHAGARYPLSCVCKRCTHVFEKYTVGCGSRCGRRCAL